MNFTRRSTLGFLTATVAMPAFAAKPSIFIGKNGFAINGYDPVAYFTQNTHVEGSAEFQSTHEGAIFLFSSADQKEMFDSDVTKYAPQYGGYCAYAVSKGSTAKTDPDAWTIHNDKLYLNFNLSVRDIWSRDMDANIAKADSNWPGVLA